MDVGVGEEEKAGMNGESNMESYFTVFKKIANGNLLCDSGKSNQAL